MGKKVSTDTSAPDNTETMLRALLATVGRSAFSPEQIHAVINPQGTGAKQIQAYNLATGTLKQRDIARRTGIDEGNFSRTVARWIEAGILFKLGDDALLHLYPVPEKLAKSQKG